MIDDIINELRWALTAGPTPGPWTVDLGKRESMTLRAGNNAISQMSGYGQGQRLITAKYIAEASPDNIAALISEIDRLRAENSALKVTSPDDARAFAQQLLVHGDESSHWSAVPLPPPSDGDYDGREFSHVAMREYGRACVRAARQWIKTTDRLPAEGESVLLHVQWALECNLNPGPLVVGYCKRRPEPEWWTDDCFGIDGTVTHWQPLPEPPQE